MKVLYNESNCGFSISLFAVLKLIKKKKLYISVYRPYQGVGEDGSLKDCYERIEMHDTYDIDDWSNMIFLEYISDDIVKKSYLDNSSDKLSHDEIHDLFLDPNHLRFDKKLIKLVEKYGSEAISGKSAKLAIAVIPEGSNFKITEHDGCEHIEQFHCDEPYYYAYK